MQTPRYVVLTTAAHVPGVLRSYACARVALVELVPGYKGTPNAISARAPGVARIVRDYGSGGHPAVMQAEALRGRLEARLLA